MDPKSAKIRDKVTAAQSSGPKLLKNLPGENSFTNKKYDYDKHGNSRPDKIDRSKKEKKRYVG